MKNQPIKTLLTHRCKLTCPCRKQLNTTQSHSRERFTLLMTEYSLRRQLHPFKNLKTKQVRQLLIFLLVKSK